MCFRYKKFNFKKLQIDVTFIKSSQKQFFEFGVNILNNGCVCYKDKTHKAIGVSFNFGLFFWAQIEITYALKELVFCETLNVKDSNNA